jgi:hypothetical protein
MFGTRLNKRTSLYRPIFSTLQLLAFRQPLPRPTITEQETARPNPQPLPSLCHSWQMLMRTVHLNTKQTSNPVPCLWQCMYGILARMATCCQPAIVPGKPTSKIGICVKWSMGWYSSILWYTMGTQGTWLQEVQNSEAKTSQTYSMC